MGNSGLKQHYETASKTGVLQISNQKLKEVPNEVLALDAVIRNLDLSNNKLAALPETIGKMKLLKHLNIESNKLEILPDTLGHLCKLEVINSSKNSLATIPKSVENLTNLKQIYLCSNKIKDFPTQLFGLKHLDVVDLSGNKIQVLPQGCAGLYATEVNLNQNQISLLSEDLAHAPKLKILRLEENCLPLDAIRPSLLKESKIHTLALDGNLFDIKELGAIEGYNEYMERYTAMKKKMF